MGSVDTPRLYRKPSGTYFIRVLLQAPSDSTSTHAGRKRLEVRHSLRTKNPELARSIAAWVNAALAQCFDMPTRLRRWSEVLLQIRKWEIPGVIKIDGPEDQENFQKFCNDNPEFREAWLERVRRTDAKLGRQDPLREHPAVLDRIRQMTAIIDSVRCDANVANRKRMSEALQLFASHMDASARNSPKTVMDKLRVLKALCAHIHANHPDLTVDPWVHEVQRHHLSSFLDTMKVRRPGQSAGASDHADKAAATVLKKISDLRSFFGFAHTSLEATPVNPTEGLTALSKSLHGNRSRQEEHYQPFTDKHLQAIFDPHAYLAYNRDPDYFWAPLLSLHLGCRLGEIVTLRLSEISRDKASGVWFIKITQQNAKNGNSARLVPISDGLRKLGFLAYVRHVRLLGADHLFPHRSTSGFTAEHDPSKNCSRKFGKYLDTLGITDESLVFHSFRHNVVTALQDHNTPLTDSMQLVGHTAQEYALAQGLMTARQGTGVHTQAYGHAAAPRMNVVSPILRLKGHLDRSITPCIDYVRLRKAGDIVRCHTTLDPDTKAFRSGWSTLKARYTEAQLAKV